MVKHSYSHTLFIALLVALAVGEVLMVGISVSAGVEGGICFGSGCDQVLGLDFCQDFLGCVVLAFIAALAVLAWRKAADFDAHRQAAAAGRGRVLPLADLRLPPPVLLTLHATIRLRMAWGSWIIRFIWVVIWVVAFATSAFMSAFVALVVRPLPKDWPEPATRLVIFLASDGVLLAFYAFVFVILALAMRERFTVTEEGVRARHLGLPRFVRWEDARLFARIDADRYELASPRTTLRFTLLAKLAARRPVVPFRTVSRRNGRGVPLGRGADEPAADGPLHATAAFGP